MPSPMPSPAPSAEAPPEACPEAHHEGPPDPVGASSRDPGCGGGRLLALQPVFHRDPGIRAPLTAAGWRMLPGPGTGPCAVGVWGRRRAAGPGLALARLAALSVLSVEDGWLRSILPAHTRPSAPASLILDDLGLAIDPAQPSRLERLIEGGAGADPRLRARARSGIARLQALGLSKYSPAPRGALPPSVPSEPAVVVIDQVAGDASVRLSGAGPADFAAMLAAARAEHPDRPLVIRTHPDPRRGYLADAALPPGALRLTAPVNPWDLLERAAAVYTVSSQLGYEAVLAGVPCHVFGRPFYAGWGMTHDRHPIPRRQARPDREALFAATHLLYPLYWDPHDRRLTDFETAVDILAERARTERPDPAATGAVFLGIAPWKRRALTRFGPAYARPPRHCRSAEAALALARAEDRALWAWASRAPANLMTRAKAAGVPVGLIEDGFLRSVGLGARLTDPAALIFDRAGIHYDPARPSALEALVAEAAGFAPDDPRLARAAALRRQIVAARVTKYNLAEAAAIPDLPRDRPVVLVPGQVADDASVLRGAAGAPARSDTALLEVARQHLPDAFLLYKPHPDVEAGLRQGGVAPAALARLADRVARDSSAAALLERVDAVWTLTSTLGFEALLRGLPVTCLGAPFYAGWGLTQDLGPIPARRQARPTLDGLVWAALIAYPRYVHPVSRLGCTPERLVAHLAEGRPAPRGGPWRRGMSRAQDLAGALGLVRWR